MQQKYDADVGVHKDAVHAIWDEAAMRRHSDARERALDDESDFELDPEPAVDEADPVAAETDHAGAAAEASSSPHIPDIPVAPPGHERPPRKPRQMRAPVAPSAAEVAEHLVTHLPYKP